MMDQYAVLVVRQQELDAKRNELELMKRSIQRQLNVVSDEFYLVGAKIMELERKMEAEDEG